MPGNEVPRLANRKLRPVAGCDGPRATHERGLGAGGGRPDRGALLRVRTGPAWAVAPSTRQLGANSCMKVDNARRRIERI